jgi:GNAT superfamily N-acetyltransferase
MTTPNMPITTRQATLIDVDTLAPLFDAYRQFYGRASDPNGARTFLHERLHHGESVLFLAFDAGGEAVGFTQLYPSFSSTAMARIFVLNDLFVQASARQQGVGTRLLAAAADHARSIGAVRLTLSTATSNATAQAVYEAAGWQRDAQFYVYNLAVST